MPCYTGQPVEPDQTEVEERCMFAMYFDLLRGLTDKQRQLFNFMKFNNFPSAHVSEELFLLCSTCDKEQMEQISARNRDIKWKHQTLNDWYEQHVKDDKEHNHHYDLDIHL